MSLPDLNTYCIPVEAVPRPCVILPGGGELCVALTNPKVPDASELAAALLGPVNSALTPLIPIFDIIDVAIALVDCVKAIEKAIASFPPRPDKLVACIPNLSNKMAKLLRLIPQLSIPATIGSILDVLITYLTGLRAQLITAARKSLRLFSARVQAKRIGSIALLVSVDCATADLDAHIKNLNENSQPVFRLINLLNTLLMLAGIGDCDHPAIPTAPTLGADISSAIAPLDEFIAILMQLRTLLPPTPALTPLGKPCG